MLNLTHQDAWICRKLREKKITFTNKSGHFKQNICKK